MMAGLWLTFTSGWMASSSTSGVLRAKTKVTWDIAQVFAFVDDCILNADNQSDKQSNMSLCAAVSNNFRLAISTKKTEVMYQLAPGNLCNEPDITMNDQKLATVT